MRDEAAKRFWAKVDLTTPSEPGACWEWTGCRDPVGYGRMKIGGVTRRTHRIAWFLEHGVWPKLVLHHCDNPPCVRIDHLYVGDHLDNSLDCEERGRMCVGEQHPGAKLTYEKVYRMKELRSFGWTYEQLAKEFGVAMATVQGIMQLRSWRHVHLSW